MTLWICSECDWEPDMPKAIPNECPVCGALVVLAWIDPDWENAA